MAGKRPANQALEGNDTVQASPTKKSRYSGPAWERKVNKILQGDRNRTIKRPTPSKYSMRAHPRAAEILAERKKAAENEALGNGLNNHLTIQATIEGPLEPPSRYRRRKIPLPTYFPPTSEELRELAAHPDWDPTTPSDSVAKPRALSPLSSSSKKGGEDQGKKDEEGKKGTKNYGKEKAGQGEGKDGKEGQVKKKGQGRDCIREAQACLAAYRREW